MLRAVLFDLDDTLVDQRTAAGAAVVGWAAELGVRGGDVQARWAEISSVHYARYQKREITFAEQRRERVRSFLGVDLSDTEADATFAGYLSRYERGWRAYDDAIPALRSARASGLSVAVFTNGDEQQQRLKLARAGLTDEVDVLVASSMLPVGKPDPRAFRAALGLVGVDAAETLMVGNSIEEDVLGALDAGISAVLLDRDGVTTRSDITAVRSLLELRAILSSPR